MEKLKADLAVIGREHIEPIGREDVLDADHGLVEERESAPAHSPPASRSGAPPLAVRLAACTALAVEERTRFCAGAERLLIAL